MGLLHLETMGAGDRPAFAFIHGILGTGANLRSLAKQFVEARPEYQAVLIDLRAHGRSSDVAGEDTVQQAARDVVETLAPFSLTGVLGHSFGGKVAMLLSEEVKTLKQLVILDSVPGTRLDARGSELTLTVLQLLDSVKGPWPTRNAFVREIVSHGLTEGVAMWLAMNLRHTGEHFVLGISLPRIHALLQSYLSVDAWPLLEETAIRRGPARWLFVNGEKSSVFTPEDSQRLNALAERSGGAIQVQTLPTGHWVHAEDPEGTRRALLQFVTSAP